MKFTTLFLFLMVPAVLRTSVHAAVLTNSTDLDIKPTTRFQSWVVGGSGLATTITVVSLTPGGRTVTTTLRAAGTLTDLQRQIDSLQDRCIMSTQQRCDLVDMLDFMLARARSSNVRAALSNLRDSLLLDKVVVNAVMPDLLAIDNALAAGANLQHQAILAQNNLVNNGGGGHCTYNYRRCGDPNNSFATRNHHCYWAIFRCTQDLNSPNRDARVACGWMMQASIQNIVRIA